MKRSLLGIRALEGQDIQDLLDLAAHYKQRVLTGEVIQREPRHAVGLLFFEGSTRTRVSFEQAAAYLGYRSTNFAGQGSSMAKGETLKDTILTLKYERLDAIVMRHHASGSAQLAAGFFGGPVINAGDGEHEHPTQALADAMTILERKGRIQGLRIAIVGDVMHSRVARSNAWLLTKLGAELNLVGPRTLMPPVMSHLPGAVHYDLQAGIEGCDVVMCLRLQRERMDSGLLSSVGEYRRLYQVNQRTLKAAHRDVMVMHPGPINRGIELDDLTADGLASAIHQQVENGIFVRMAALHWVFDGPVPDPKPTGTGTSEKPTRKAAKKTAAGGKS